VSLIVIPDPLVQISDFPDHVKCPTLFTPTTRAEFVARRKTWSCEGFPCTLYATAAPSGDHDGAPTPDPATRVCCPEARSSRTSVPSPEMNAILRPSGEKTPRPPVPRSWVSPDSTSIICRTPWPGCDAPAGTNRSTRSCRSSGDQSSRWLMLNAASASSTVRTAPVSVFAIWRGAFGGPPPGACAPITGCAATQSPSGDQTTGPFPAVRQDGAVARWGAVSGCWRRVVGACAYVVGCRGWPGRATYGGRRPCTTLRRR
jgi:hypothetical protein